jgi:hypothetical protein
MKTWKNTANQNSSPVTTVYFAQSDVKPTNYGKWEVCDEALLETAKHNVHLFTEAGVRYFGRV